MFNSDIRGFTRMSEGTEPQSHRRHAQRVLRADGRDDLQVRRHARQVHGRRDHGVLGRARRAPRRRRRAACSARSSRWRCSASSIASASEGSSSPLAIGIGIHTGPLVAGYIGSSKALTYTVIGDTANTSARLCGIAHSGQIIVSEPTYARLGTRFEVEELPPAHVKSKEQPLRIFNVIRERPQFAVPRAIGG